MKIGIATYSLSRLRKTGEFTTASALDWIADAGAQHVEINHLPELDITDKGLDAVRAQAAARGLDISSYTFSANFAVDTEADLVAQIDAVKVEIDRAHRLGARFVRHDVGSRPPDKCSTAEFDRYLPTMARGCREAADHAAQYGIVTSSENHGHFVQDSERVRRLIAAVGRPNYRTTIDIGNFMGVDEDPLAAVKLNLPFASFIHVKDNHLQRDVTTNPGEGWRKTRAGRYLRAAIFGHGDAGVKDILRAIVASGYDGYLSLEFEGIEEPRLGCRISFNNLARYLEEIAAEKR